MGCECQVMTGRPVRVKHDYGQTGRSKTNVNFAVIGEMYKFCRNRKKFKNFVEIAGIRIIGLKVWTTMTL